MEVALISRLIGDSALRHEIDDMRLGHHPAPQWERDAKYWILNTIIKYMPHSDELKDEAWAEHRALRLDAPAKPYQRRVSVVAAEVAAAVVGE
jgi:hypothetical protein